MMEPYQPCNYEHFLLKILKVNTKGGVLEEDILPVKVTLILDDFLIFSFFESFFLIGSVNSSIMTPLPFLSYDFLRA